MISNQIIGEDPVNMAEQTGEKHVEWVQGNDNDPQYDTGTTTVKEIEVLD